MATASAEGVEPRVSARSSTCDKSHGYVIWLSRLRFGVIDDVHSDYRLAAPLLIRMMGAGLTLAGVAVVLVVLGGALFSWPAAVLSTVVVVAVVAVVALAAVLMRLTPVVRLGEVGYEVRWVRGAGVKQGRWKDVEDVVATTVADARVVVLRRRDGQTTTIPVGILAGSADDFVRDLRQHLDTGHGYRPIQ
jgi:hypothetical protein